MAIVATNRRASAFRSVLWLLTIPLLSVASARLVGDIASSGDPAELLSGLAAAAAGTVAGLVLVRLVRAVSTGLRRVVDALIRWWPYLAVGLLSDNRPRLIPLPIAADASSPFVRTVRRRGPPRHLD